MRSSMTYNLINGSQLAKMKKSIPDMSLPWNLYGWNNWSKKFQIYFKNNKKLLNNFELLNT